MATMVLHVVPRARRSEVVGQHGDAIRVRVAAPPADGAANHELIRFLAERLGVARGDVKIVHGTAGRRKIVSVAGVTDVRARHVLLDDGE